MQDTDFPIKERMVWVTDKKTGVRYQELRKYQYDPQRKYNRQLSSERTGYKLMPGEDTPTRSRPMQKRKKSAQADAASPVQDTACNLSATTASVPDADTAQSPNASTLLDWACSESGLADALSAAYDKTTADKILTVAHFMVQTGGSASAIEDWLLEHDAPYREGLSADSCYELFEQLGQDDTGMQNLFRKLSILIEDDEPLLAFVTTSPSSFYESDMTMASGYNKSCNGADSRLLTFFSQNSEIPVSFEVWHGLFQDLSSMTEAITRMKRYNEKRQITLVAGTRLFSPENVCRLCRNHVSFIMPATLEDGWIKQQFDESLANGMLQKSLRTQPERFRCSAWSYKEVPAAVIQAKPSFSMAKSNNQGENEEELKDFNIYCHFYTNTEHAADGKITAEDTYVLISNCDQDPWTALECYLKRNKIEALYRRKQSGMDDSKPRLCDLYTVKGKEMCNLIALGILFFIQRAKNTIMKQCFEKVPDAESYSQPERDTYENLGKWLREKNAGQILAWYDCIKTVRVENKIGRQRWSPENMARDRLFWKLLLAWPAKEGREPHV